VRQFGSKRLLHILGGTGEHHATPRLAALGDGEAVFVGKCLDAGNIGRSRSVDEPVILARVMVSGLRVGKCKRFGRGGLGPAPQHYSSLHDFVVIDGARCRCARNHFALTTGQRDFLFKRHGLSSFFFLQYPVWEAR